MADLYPEIEPHVQGMLEVACGDLVYWEVCGDPNGKPALVLHGGPGSGCTPWFRRLFDPAAYRVVLFDQHGSGGADLTRVPLRQPCRPLREAVTRVPSRIASLDNSRLPPTLACSSRG